MALSTDKQLQLQLLQSRLTDLERQINEYTVIEYELSSLPAGNCVYTRQASGLVFYKTDPVKSHGEHKRKLEELKKFHSATVKEIQTLTERSVK